MALAARVRDLSVALQSERALAGESRQLGQLLELRDRAGLPTRAADIVGSSPTADFRTLTINLGTGDGVGADMAVVAPAGAVGRVVTPSRHAAKVQLLVDRNAAVAVMIARSRVQGIAMGSGENLLRLEYVPGSADLVNGDEVVTSGIDGVYPRVRRRARRGDRAARRVVPVDPRATGRGLLDARAGAGRDGAAGAGRGAGRRTRERPANAGAGRRGPPRPDDARPLPGARGDRRGPGAGGRGVPEPQGRTDAGHPLGHRGRPRAGRPDHRHRGPRRSRQVGGRLSRRDRRAGVHRRAAGPQVRGVLRGDHRRDDHYRALPLRARTRPARGAGRGSRGPGVGQLAGRRRPLPGRRSVPRALERRRAGR